MKNRQKKMDLFTVDTKGDRNEGDRENENSEILYSYNETESVENSENSDEEAEEKETQNDDADEEEYDYGGN